MKTDILFFFLNYECTHTTDTTSHDRLNATQFCFFLFTIYTIAWHAIVTIEWSFWPTSSENKHCEGEIQSERNFTHCLSSLNRAHWKHFHFHCILYNCLRDSLVIFRVKCFAAISNRSRFNFTFNFFNSSDAYVV